MFSKVIVISGFPGIGKSYLFSQPHLRVKDSDSSTFPKEDFPNNYIEHIKEVMESGEVDYLLVSSHDVVRNALIDNSIKAVVVYPSLEDKDTYISRYIQRGSPEGFIKLLESNFENWVNEIDEEASRTLGDTSLEYLKLREGQYLSDVLSYITKLI